jgi:hypothetical protein
VNIIFSVIIPWVSGWEISSVFDEKLCFFFLMYRTSAPHNVQKMMVKNFGQPVEEE